jgi:hypothetical protein
MTTRDKCSDLEAAKSAQGIVVLPKRILQHYNDDMRLASVKRNSSVTYSVILHIQNTLRTY